jgi:hypothetical protein
LIIQQKKSAQEIDIEGDRSGSVALNPIPAKPDRPIHARFKSPGRL